MMSSFADDLRSARAAQHEEVLALRRAGSTRRGLGDDFYRLIGERYRAIVANGERHAVTALAKRESVDKSTASRWISGARTRGFLA